MSDLAWTGRVLMDNAAWGDENGSTVTFRLPMNHDAEDKRNPFHSFTKRRKGKAGTRFMMACHTAGEGVRHALYEDEAMLAGWNDSQQKGHTVKLWLCNDNMGHPFDGVSRKTELLISLIELDDDNEPIDQKMRDRVERQGTRSSERVSYVAAMLCKEDNFYAFINEDIEQSGDFISPDVLNEEDAKQWIYQKCGISSRAELDAGHQSAVHFDNIRKAYLEFVGEDRVPF